MTFTGGGDSARPSSSGRFKRAAEVPPRRGAKIGRDFVVGQLVCDPQAQLGLRAQICSDLHGRFSKSASIGPVAFDWTWMSKSLLNVPTALLCKAAFAGAPFDSGSLGCHESNAARLRPVPDIRAKLRKEYNYLFDRNPGRRTVGERWKK
jgi:hypothetical protein